VKIYRVPVKIYRVPVKIWGPVKISYLSHLYVITYHKE